MRTPIACDTALAIAASGGTMTTSPAPRTPNGCRGFGTSTMTVSMEEGRASRHAVVEERGVHHPAGPVVDVFLVQRPADALGRTTLHLALDIAGVDRVADVGQR